LNHGHNSTALRKLRGEEILKLLEDHSHLDDRYSYSPEKKNN